MVKNAQLQTPDWVTEYIKTWMDRLNIGNWRIKTTLALCVDEDPECMASCQQLADYNRANITFRADIADTPDWRKTIIHELLHVAHSRIDSFIECAVLSGLAEEAQQVAILAYTQHNESFVSWMADTLYNATCALDYPEEYPKEE